jgi:hypothetical protein
MKKTILKNLLVLCFAFGGLFLISNNVIARDVLQKETEPTITCNQHSGPNARCWRFSVLSGGCEWTGNQAHACIML